MLTPPAFSLLPPSIISAELRRGSLVRCGPGVRGIGWPDNAVVRASTLLPPDAGEHELAVAAYSAAWVWGAEWQTGQPTLYSTLNGMRFLRRIGAPVRVREYDIDRSHTVMLAGVRITSPPRTAYDLLYLDEDEYERFGLSSLRSLLEREARLPKDLATRYHERNRPYRRRAEARLDEVRRCVIRTASLDRLDDATET